MKLHTKYSFPISLENQEEQLIILETPKKDNISNISEVIPSEANQIIEYKKFSLKEENYQEIVKQNEQTSQSKELKSEIVSIIDYTRTSPSKYCLKQFQKEQQIEEIYENGDKYIGSKKHNKRSGYGEYYYHHGEIYKGN